MKKITFLYIGGVFILAACQSTMNTANTNPAKPDNHVARLALDVEGRYDVGKPVAGNDIREIWVKSGNRYAVTLANGISVNGLYTWDISGNRIILDIRGDQCAFFAGENFLKYEGEGKQKNWTFQKR